MPSLKHSRSVLSTGVLSLAHKPVVIEALAHDLPADWHFLWDERAAIMEYDGKFPREQAEALALAEIRKLMALRTDSSQAIDSFDL